jgi:hypothetical protein
MGKKKASRSRKLRPLMQAAIDSGQVYVREQTSKTFIVRWGPDDNPIFGPNGRDGFVSYEVCLGSDSFWVSPTACQTALGKSDIFVPISVHVYDSGDIDWKFIESKHVLDRSNAAWLSAQLEEIIVMYKLGGFQSDRMFNGFDSLDAKMHWRYNRRKTTKKKKI